MKKTRLTPDERFRIKSESLKKIWAGLNDEDKRRRCKNISRAKKGIRSKWMSNPEIVKTVSLKNSIFHARRFAKLGKEKHELFTPEAQTLSIINSIKETKTSPTRGRFETNIHAEDWRLCDPNGNIYHFHNLQHFIRNHKNIFSDSFAKELRNNGEAKVISSFSKLSPRRKKRAISALNGWTWDD